MFAVNFCASCFDSMGNSIGKKIITLDWENAVYRPLFTLANILILKATSILKTKKKREICRIGKTKFYMGSISDRLKQ